MPVVLTQFVQKPLEDGDQWGQVVAIAGRLLQELNADATLEGIMLANQPGTPSSQVQAAFKAAAEALGFRSEARGLFLGSIPGLRPDYFRPLDGSGILLEVERGKTTTNNMDLLDFWSATYAPTRTTSSSSCHNRCGTTPA
jgi:hypothetical protein